MLPIERFDEPDEALRKQVDDGLSAHNAKHSAVFLEEGDDPEKKSRTLDLFVRDADGRVRAGLLGRLRFAWSGQGWLYVSHLWVDESLRGQDYGTRLLTQAEEIASETGCSGAYLTTFSFQARPFYEKQGYRCVGTLEGYPPGGSYYWMAKQPL
jgi:GNAT superfamily N-acetyltransferase